MAQTKDGNFEKELEAEYHVSWAIIAYKFLFGLFEFVAGLGLILWGRMAFGLYHNLITQELSEDPHDILAILSEKIVPSLLSYHGFLAVYLMLLGGAKVAGAIGLIRQKNWGVDLLVGLTLLMFPFQVIGLILHPAVFDVIYLAVGLLIAFYLVNFKPRAWISKMVFLGRNQVARLRR